ncbi:hypothetical protein [Nocardiopsis sp. LOL_012]|uniref:hypothetical protein n=1 Tax=Nocardiopsis sp. LOL_012 TaxID=3345409 RepID=UPI003A85956F
MGIVERMASVAVAALAVTGVAGTATPVSADGVWIDRDRVNAISGPRTALERETPVGTVQVRHGVDGEGTRYVWARVLNGTARHEIVLEVDLDGDRVPDDRAAHYLAGGGTGWTWGRAAQAGHAFRACVVSGSAGCEDEATRTAWR